MQGKIWVKSHIPEEGGGGEESEEMKEGGREERGERKEAIQMVPWTCSEFLIYIPHLM